MQKILVYGIIVIISLTELRGQPSPVSNFEIISIIDIIKENHFDYSDIDEARAKKIISGFLYSLDPEGILFSQQQINALNLYAGDLLEEIKTGRITFLEQAISMYNESIIQADKILKDLESEDLNIHEHKNFILPSHQPNYNHWPKTESEKVVKWKERILFNSLLLNTNLEDQAEDLRLAIKRSIEIYSCRIKKLLDTKDNSQLVLSKFLNAFCQSFDPDTNFLPREEYLQFQRMLEKFQFSYGMDMEFNNLQQIYVENITFGGPSWETQQIHAGDLINKIHLIPSDEEINLFCMQDEELFFAIHQDEVTGIKLQIFHETDGTKEVKVMRQQTESYENQLQSYIIERKHRVGYILMPTFYSDETQHPMLGVANDLAKEIMMLKRDRIEGLIIDLRDNSGGSMLEAINTAGIFINQGPVTWIKTKEEPEPELIKDFNRGTAYNGPLILMVNRASASASELLSGVIQYYGLGLIVGDTTYGKGSGQDVFEIGKQGDQVKVTVLHFFNLDGLSHEGKGIFPDIHIPDPAHLFVPRRRAYTTTGLNINSSVKREKIENLPFLKSESQKRVFSGEYFSRVKASENFINKWMIDGLSIPLSPDLFNEKIEEIDDHLTTLFNIDYKIRDDIKILNHKYETDLIALDKEKSAQNEAMILSLRNDGFLEETYNIMVDLIEN